MNKASKDDNKGVLSPNMSHEFEQLDTCEFDSDPNHEEQSPLNQTDISKLVKVVMSSLSIHDKLPQESSSLSKLLCICTPVLSCLVCVCTYIWNVIQLFLYIAEKFGRETFSKFAFFKHLSKKVWWINRSAKRLLIVNTNLDGLSLENHEQFDKFT